MTRKRPLAWCLAAAVSVAGAAVSMYAAEAPIGLNTMVFYWVYYLPGWASAIWAAPLEYAGALDAVVYIVQGIAVFALLDLIFRKLARARSPKA